MFTGLIDGIGEIMDISQINDAQIAKIQTPYSPESIKLGASIACNGACMTVTEIATHQGLAIITIHTSSESLAKTNLGNWRIGTKINLERSLKMGDEIGGHWVSGHVDGKARLIERIIHDEDHELWFEVPFEFAKYIAPKGSIALNGTSLTVNAVEGQKFSVNLIPHSLDHTIWREVELNELCNFEIDMLARYIERLREFDRI